MFCKNCGTKLDDNAKFCANCGWQEGSDVTKESKIKNARGFKIPVMPIIGVIGIIAIGFVVKTIFFGGNSLAKQAKNVKVVTEYSLAKQAKNIKVVTEYSSDTLVDEMDAITFGSYPQFDISGEDKEPIEWLVLEKNDEEMLLLSKYILDCKCYNDERKDVTWETCTLREWSNSTFYNKAFSDDEKENIIKSNVVNKDSSVWGTSGGNDTKDYVYLLSIDECRKYFGNGDTNKRLATKGTKYAYDVDNHGNILNMEDYYGSEWFGNSYFWLRSPGYDQDNATKVGTDGGVYTSGDNVDYNYCGFRPLLRVRYK